MAVELQHISPVLDNSKTIADLLRKANHLMVEVWFALRDGRRICLPRITEPEAEQQLLLHHLRWSLPEQPPPKIYPRDVR